MTTQILSIGTVGRNQVYCILKMNLIKTAAALSRWTARIGGASLVGVVVCIAIGEGVPNLFAQPVRIQLGFLGLALLMIGILAGWRWELGGGILSISGWVLFLVTILKSPRALMTFDLALPGALYVMSALLRRWHKNPTPDQ